MVFRGRAPRAAGRGQRRRAAPRRAATRSSTAHSPLGRLSEIRTCRLQVEQEQGAVAVGVAVDWTRRRRGGRGRRSTCRVAARAATVAMSCRPGGPLARAASTACRAGTRESTSGGGHDEHADSGGAVGRRRMGKRFSRRPDQSSTAGSGRDPLDAGAAKSGGQRPPCRRGPGGPSAAPRAVEMCACRASTRQSCGPGRHGREATLRRSAPRGCRAAFGPVTPNDGEALTGLGDERGAPSLAAAGPCRTRRALAGGPTDAARGPDVPGWSTSGQRAAPGGRPRPLRR